MSALAGDVIDISMNEVEMTALKATRGAGLPWSIAEDVGRASRWLAANGAEWSGLLLDALEPAIALDPESSPFLGGARFSDRLDVLADAEFQATVSRPVWLLAMLAANAFNSSAFAVSVGEERFAVRVDAATATAPLNVLASIERADVSLRLGEERFAHAIAPSRTRSVIPVSHHAALDVLVYKTYVPNSVKSRLRGAGARPGY